MPSQKQIALLAKVSQSVVSRALSGRAREFGISEETVTRVRQIAGAMNYHPNQAANMLLGRQTRLIGVVVRAFDDPFLGTLLEELNRRALQAGFTLLVVGCESGEFNPDEIKLLQSYRPDTFIVIGTMDFAPRDEGLLSSGKLIIQIGIGATDNRIVSCGIDEAWAARLLVEHLEKLGHRTVGIVAGSTLASSRRIDHLKNAIQERNLTLSLPCVYQSKYDSALAGADAAQYFMDTSVRSSWCSAVVATGDMIALSFIRCIGDKEIAVPGDLSVASYSDIEYAALARPSLTTIQIPVRDLAATAMEIITGSRPPESVVHAPVLVARESTAAATV